MIGHVAGLDEKLLEMLTELERRLNFELVITSLGRPDPPTSAHARWLAADIHVEDSRQRYWLVRSALLEGFARIGIYDRHVHLDIDHEKPSQVIWLGTSR